MSNDDSVTVLIGGLLEGEDDVIRRLWDRYFERLVRLAGSRIPRSKRRTTDEEDIALSAFNSFCDRAARGQFPQLADRDDLWRLLSTITTRKVLESLRNEGRQKRGGGRVIGESGLGDGGGDGIGQFLGREPTPDEAVQFADECDRLFSKLEDPVLRTVALRKLEGFSSEEIAAELKVSARTVDRKLGLVRALWLESPA